jgi:hypothetical protein
MDPRPRPITQLENFTPTTTQDDRVNAGQVIAAPSNNTTNLLPIHFREKRKAEVESHFQASKLGRLCKHQSHANGAVSGEVDDSDQPGINRSYRAFMKIDQAGSTIIAHEQAFPDRLVAVKRVKQRNGTSVLHLRQYNSDQVVSILDFYVEGPDIVVVYEAMDISLLQMVSVCPVHVTKVAAIFKEVSSPVRVLCC